MANYATLKAAIAAAIRENGNKEITGNLLQQQLLAMVNSLGVGYQYMGIATPATNPGTPDQNVFYIASTAGTYANFDSLVLADGEIAILKYNGAWSKESTGAASLKIVSQLGQEVNGIITNQEIGVVQINQTYDLVLPITLEAGKRYIIHVNSNSHLISGTTPAFYENTTGGHYDFIAIDTDVEVIPTTDVNKYVIYIPGNRVSSTGNIIITITNNNNISERVANLEGDVNDIDSHILGKTIYDNLIAIAASNAQYNLEFQPGILLKKGWKYNVRINSDSIIDSGRDIPLYQSYSGGAYTPIRVNRDNIITINEDTTELMFYVAAGWVTNAGNVEVTVTDVGVDNSIISTMDNVAHLKNEVLGGGIYDGVFPITQTSAQYNLILNPFVVLKKGWKYIVRINSNSVLDTSRQIPLYESFSGGVYHWITLDSDVEITIENETTELMFYVAAGWVLQEGNITIAISTNGITETEALKIEKESFDDSLSMSVFEEIGICGDSYSAGAIMNDDGVWIAEPRITWGKQIGRMFNIDVTLFAKGGLSTRTWLTDSAGLAALLADTPKQMYLLNFGINDASYVPLGTIADIHDEDYTLNPDTYYGNYGKIIEQIKGHAPNAKIVMVKVLAPTYSDAGYSWSEAAIEEIAQHYGIPYLETMDSKFLASDWFVNNCRSNGGHPTAIGLSGVAKAICTLLQKAMMGEFYSYFEHYYPHDNI